MTIGAMKGLKAYEQVQKIQGLQQQQQSQPAVGGPTKSADSFGDLLSGAIQEVDKMQKSADEKITGFVTGKGGVTTHDAMIAIEQADVAFQLMNQVRSKIVRAYEEVMRTQV